LVYNEKLRKKKKEGERKEERRMSQALCFSIQIPG
jgi:hypothetical protein